MTFFLKTFIVSLLLHCCDWWINFHASIFCTYSVLGLTGTYRTQHSCSSVLSRVPPNMVQKWACCNFWQHPQTQAVSIRPKIFLQAKFEVIVPRGWIVIFRFGWGWVNFWTNAHMYFWMLLCLWWKNKQSFAHFLLQFAFSKQSWFHSFQNRRRAGNMSSALSPSKDRFSALVKSPWANCILLFLQRGKRRSLQVRWGCKYFLSLKSAT